MNAKRKFASLIFDNKHIPLQVPSDEKQVAAPVLAKLPKWMATTPASKTNDDAFHNKYAPVNFEKNRIKQIMDRNEQDKLLLKLKLDAQSKSDFAQVVHGRVVILDIESTGFADDDMIIEVGAVEVYDGCKTGFLYHSLIRNKNSQGEIVPIHEKAAECHKLTTELLETSPSIDTVLEYAILHI